MEIFPVTHVISLPPLVCGTWDKHHIVNSLAAAWACIIPLNPLLSVFVVMATFFLLAVIGWYGLRNNLIRYIAVILLTFGSLFYNWQWGGYGSSTWGIRFNSVHDIFGFCLYDFFTISILTTY